MRVCKMGYLRKVEGIYQVNVQIPERIRAIVGELTGKGRPVATLVRSTKTGNEREANDIAVFIVPELKAIRHAAEARLRHAADPWAEYREWHTQFGQRSAHVVAARARWMGKMPAAEMKLAACPSAVVIKLWAKTRKKGGVPKPKAIADKRRAMRELFAFVGKPDDMTGIGEGDIQNFKEHLIALGGSAPYDRLVHIKALFQVAFENKKVVPNPAATLIVPPKRQGLKRPGFNPTDAAKILTAANLSDVPIIKWGNQLGAYIGLIASEFADADSRDVCLVDGIPSFRVRGDYRTIIRDDDDTDDNELKSTYRTRDLPLPSVMRRSGGFWDYAQALPPGPLFPGIEADKHGLRNTKASARIMEWLRTDVGIEDVVDPVTGKTLYLQTFYSWRHRLATLLQKIEPSSDRRRYICGHGPVDVHATFYVEHPVAELLPIIEEIVAMKPKALAEGA